MSGSTRATAASIADAYLSPARTCQVRDDPQSHCDGGYRFVDAVVDLAACRKGPQVGCRRLMAT
jgi:hypothetical protein